MTFADLYLLQRLKARFPAAKVFRPSPIYFIFYAFLKDYL